MSLQHDSVASSTTLSQSQWPSQTPELTIVHPKSVSVKLNSAKTGMDHLSPYRLQKHLDIRAKIAVETKLDVETLKDVVNRSFRSPNRKLFSRGHEVHESGQEIPARPVGSSPILSEGHSTSHRMDFSTSLFRPLTREQQAQSRQSSRPTNQPVLASGILRPGDPFNQSLSMRYPLNNISYSSPSNFSTNIIHADLPPDAYFILQDSKPMYITSSTRQKFLETMPMTDRIFISRQRMPKKSYQTSRLRGPGSSSEVMLIHHSSLGLNAGSAGSYVDRPFSPDESSFSPPGSPSSHSRPLTPEHKHNGESRNRSRSPSTGNSPDRKPEATSNSQQNTSRSGLTLSRAPFPLLQSVSQKNHDLGRLPAHKHLQYSPIVSNKQSPESVFKLDYSLPGSPERKDRHICRKRLS